MIDPVAADRIRVVLQGVENVEGFIVVLNQGGKGVVLINNFCPEQAIDAIQNVAQQLRTAIAEEPPLQVI